MSKGYGNLQRKLLNILSTASAPVDTFVLTASAFAVPESDGGQILITNAQVMSTLRALRKLASTGAIFDLGYEGRRKLWGNEQVAVERRLREVQAEMKRRIASGTVDEDWANQMLTVIKRAAALGYSQRQNPT